MTRRPFSHRELSADDRRPHGSCSYLLRSTSNPRRAETPGYSRHGLFHCNTLQSGRFVRTRSGLAGVVVDRARPSHGAAVQVDEARAAAQEQAHAREAKVLHVERAALCERRPEAAIHHGAEGPTCRACRCRHRDRATPGPHAAARTPPRSSAVARPRRHRGGAHARPALAPRGLGVPAALVLSNQPLDHAHGAMARGFVKQRSKLVLDDLVANFLTRAWIVRKSSAWSAASDHFSHGLKSSSS